MFAPISGADYEQRTSHNVRTLLGALDVCHRLFIESFCLLGGGSEGFLKSMTLLLALKWPYLDKDGLPEALDRCIRLLPPRRIF